MAKGKKDTASFIKKVSSAGRRGDTELAYLSPKARDLLKKLGGAGTKNPKTKIREFYSEFELFPEWNEDTGLRIAEAMQQFQEPSFAPAAEVIEPLFTAPTAAADFEALRLAEERAQQEAARLAAERAQQEAAQQEAARLAAERAQQEAAQQEAARLAAERAQQEAAQQEAQRLAAEQAAAAAREQERNRTLELIRQQEERTAPVQGTAAADFARLMETPQPGQEPLASVPATFSEPPAPTPATAAPQWTAASALAAMAAAREQMPAAIAELYNQPAPPPPAPVAAPALTASRVREQEDLWRPRDETIGQRPGLISPRFATIREVPDERVDRAAEEAARREAEAEARARAEEEANRKAAEEAARKAAEEEAARRAAEEAAARRAAEEQARIRAAEEARIREIQDAQARRAAEEARRVAEEAARRTAEEAAARRAAEEEAARRAAEEEAARRTAATAPAPTPAPPPLGLIESKLPTAPSSGTTVPGAGDVRTSDFIDDNLNGIDDRDERTAAPAPTPAPTPAPDLGGVRTGDFIDENLNGVDDRDEPAKKGSSRDWFNLIGGVDPNSDVGRLIARLRPGGARKFIGAPSVGGSTGTLPPVTSPVAPAPLPTAPVAPPASMPPSSGYIPQPIPTPGYVAAPLPQMPGAGTPTPFFQPNAGGLTPGTLPVSGPAPQSLITSNVPLQAIGANPNLSPNVLGGQANLGYYRDRMGNLIMSPGAVRPPGFAKGGSANADLLKELETLREERADSGMKDIESARAMLEQLSNAPAASQTEVSLSPIAQSVRRTSRRPIRQETDRGTAKGMAMELEEITKVQEPRASGDERAKQKTMEDVRAELGMPTFSRATLSKATIGREGPLMARRFNEGGEVDDSTPLQRRIYMESVSDPAKATAPITEKSMSAKELDKLRKLIDIAERNPALSEKTGKPLKGVVDYAHQRMLMEQVDPMGSAPLFMRDSDYNAFESGNLRNTLGQFTFERMPDGSLVVRDRYDYTGDVGERTNPLIQYANKKGVNRPVEIRLPAAPKKKGK